MVRPPKLILCFVAAVLVLGGACSKDEKKAATAGSSKGKQATTTASTQPASAPLTITGIEPYDTKPPSDEVVAKVKAVLERYVADAMVGPLRSGQPAGDLSAIFTPDALPKVAPGAPERAALVDEGLPAPASTSVTFEKADVVLHSVAGGDEVVALLAARIDFKARALGPQLDVDVVRQGDLILVPAGDGGWQIDAFSVHASRDTRPKA